MTTEAPAAPASADTAPTGSQAPSTPSAPAAPSTTPAAPADPAAPSAPPATDAQPPENKPGETPPATEYKIPDEFKEKPWASKIKSEADLWKALSGAQELIGKRYLPIDPSNVSPEELAQYKAAHRPADKAEYKFGDDVSDMEREAISNILWEEGVPAWQANKIIENYTKAQSAEIAKLYDKDSYMAEMKKSFGDGFENKVGRVVRTLNQVLSPEDQAALENTPNLHLATIYRAVNTILEKYGVEEAGIAGNSSPGRSGPTDVDKELAENMKQIQELEKNPHHKADDKQALLEARQRLIDKKHNIRR